MVGKKSSFSLMVALAFASVGCGSGPEDLDTGGGPISIFPPPTGNPGVDAGSAGGGTAGSSPSTLGGTSTLGGATAGTGTGGTTAGTRPGGTTAGTSGGTTAGTSGGTTAGTSGGTTAGTSGGSTAGTDAGATTGGTGSGDAGVGSSDAGAKDAGGSTGGGTDSGTCCPTGDCLCHGTVPTRLGAAKGPFKTASLRLSTGTAYYPTDAMPPFAGISICPGFTNTGPEMTDWGPFYASWGIVTVVTNTGGLDDPSTRGRLLIGSISALKAENTKSGSPLNGKMSGRYGTSGYSMGGGGTTYASSSDPTLKSSVGLAAWEPIGRNIKVPTLLMCGSADLVAECFHTDQSYDAIPASTPKMKIVISGAEHLASWFGPDQGGGGVSGGYALAFNKVYLEGDTRWKTLLLTKPQGHEMITNITP
jgi:hypothetical protein